MIERPSSFPHGTAPHFTFCDPILDFLRILVSMFSEEDRADEKNYVRQSTGLSVEARL